MEDHDQRFKVLLQEFFREFIELFYPEIAACFDFSQLEWLQQELFTDPPQGEKVVIDLAAKLRSVKPLSVNEQVGQVWLALIHVEIEWKDSVAQLRPRIYAYYHELRQRYRLPVLPIGLYLRVGLEGIGWDVYEEAFLGHVLLHFEYPYVGLPALDGPRYLDGENPLGVALAALMHLPEERRAELKAKAQEHVARSTESDFRKFLLWECIEACLPLTEMEQAQYQTLLSTEPYREVREMVLTTYQRGRLEALRAVMEMQLERRFGQLPEEVLARLQDLPEKELMRLAKIALTAQTFQELGLNGDQKQE